MALAVVKYSEKSVVLLFVPYCSYSLSSLCTMAGPPLVVKTGQYSTEHTCFTFSVHASGHLGMFLYLGCCKWCFGGLRSAALFSGFWSQLLWTWAQQRDCCLPWQFYTPSHSRGTISHPHPPRQELPFLYLFGNTCLLKTTTTTENKQITTKQTSYVSQCKADLSLLSHGIGHFFLGSCWSFLCLVYVLFSSWFSWYFHGSWVFRAPNV